MGDVQQKAEDYSSGQLSTEALHAWLSSRRTPIESDLEADLWGLVFEVGSREIDEQGAREWLATKYGLNQPVI